MLPEKFIKRIRTQKYLDADALVKALNEPSPVSIRINPSKWDRVPEESEAVSWSDNGFYLHQRPSFTLDPLFHSGCFYPQEASSMFLEEVIRQILPDDSGIRVLDLCGAPGGKSLILSDLIGNESLLVSNDAIRQRAAILAETTTKWGAGNIIVTQNDPSAFGKLHGYFDIVVVDAPCSGEGMFRSEIAVKEWSEMNTGLCSDRQRRILSDVWPSLKEDGILVYSTCTFNPGENEENLKWLLETNEAETVGINIRDFHGIAEIDYDGVHGYGFYPDKIKGEGFFISAVRKKGPVQEVHLKKQSRRDLIPAKNDLIITEKWTDFPDGRIFKWGSELFASPCSLDEYLFLLGALRIVRTGQKIAMVKNGAYLPTHELALSESLKIRSFPGVEVGLQEALAYMRRDNFKPANAELGWNLLTYKGVSIGFINNIGNRVNNYFPVEWRIRMNLPQAGSENLIKWKDRES